MMTTAETSGPSAAQLRAPFGDSTPPTPRSCKGCGRALPRRAKFCPDCGRRWRPGLRRRLAAHGVRRELAELTDRRRRTALVLAETQGRTEREAATLIEAWIRELDRLIETKEGRLSELQPIPEPSPPPDEGTPPMPAPVPEPYPPPDEADLPSAQE